MDLQIGIYIGIFSILASSIIYTISSYYSLKEDSFDEARANRRKVIKEYWDQSRPSGDKTKHKKSKKTKKGGKDKKSEPIVEETEQKKDIALIETTKENIQPAKEMVVNKKVEPVTKAAVKPKAPPNNEKEDLPPNSSAVPTENSKKKNNEKKVKINKVNEKQPEQQQEPVPSPPVPAPPKEPEKKPEKKVEVKTEKKKPDVTNARKQGGIEKQDINMNSIILLIRKAEFSRSEIQLLIDTLLTSCVYEAEWLKVKKIESGRQESTVKLKKQLSEIEASLKNEKQITQGLQAKLKELRSEMASDKSSVTILKEQVGKIQQDKDELIYEKTDLLMRIKALTDERDELQEQVDKEISKAQQQQKIDDDRHHETVLALKDQINNVSSQLEVVETENASLKSTINFLEAELKLHENCQGQIAGMEQALNGISEKLIEKDNEISNLREHMDSLISVTENIKKENQDLKMQRDYLSEQLSLSSKELENLKEEFELLSIKLAEAEELYAENGGGVPNGFDSSHDPIKCHLIVEEKENLKADLLKEREKYNEHMKALHKDILLSNNERDKLRELFEQRNSEIESLKKKMANLSDHSGESKDTISQLRNTINERNVELDNLKLELEKYKQRNNELRNKNWKVVEALSTAEKALQNKMKAEAVENGSNKNNLKNVEELKNNVNTFVRRLFPDIKLEDYKGHFNDWLRSVEDTVTSNNMKYCPQDLHNQNIQLQSLVAHYKNIISDTEDMLNKLQNHIEVQESKWKEEMSCLQREVENLRALQKNTS